MVPLLFSPASDPMLMIGTMKSMIQPVVRQNSRHTAAGNAVNLSVRAARRPQILLRFMT
jgi:hypothetical protein